MTVISLSLIVVDRCFLDIKISQAGLTFIQDLLEVYFTTENRLHRMCYILQIALYNHIIK